MLSKCFRTWQYLCVDCFNIHVGLKCKEKNASRYFRDEYKKNTRLLDIFKEFPHQEKPFKGNGKFICRWFKRISDNEKEVKNGSIQIELPPASVPENGKVNCRK